MNLDRICYFTVLSLLPLLCLPEKWLWVGIVWGSGTAMIALWRRQVFLLLCCLLIGFHYGRIMYFAENLYAQSAYTSHENIRIIQILKDNEYRAAIAQRQNGQKIYLIWQSEKPLHLHEYHAELRLRPISARLNSGNFNRQRWLIAQGISATATVKQATLLDMQSVGWRETWLERTKRATDGLPTQGLILALAFGERAWMETSHWQIFQQTTTAHLIAISGLHIALAFGVGFWSAKVLLWCGRRAALQAVQNPHFFAMAIGFVFAWGYSFLAGFSFPTLRAIFAISIVIACRALRIHYTPWQYWWRVVTLLILLDPFALLSDSFWLSVSAVATLIFWYRHFPLRAFERIYLWQKSAFWKRFIASLLHLQLGITLCFLPVQLFFFEGNSPHAFLANLLTVPLYSIVIVPLILFSLLSDNLLNSWQWVDWLIFQNLDYLTPLAGQWHSLSQEQQWHWLCVDLFVLALLYFRHHLRIYFSTLVVLVCGIHQSYLLPMKWLPQPNVEWVNFDVGQGLAMAFVYREAERKYAVLYDTGASWQGGSMAELEIIPYLKRDNITPIALIVSHEDNDHAGGVVPILREFPAIRLILSGRNRDNDQPFEDCITGQNWTFGGLRLKAVYPTKLAEQAENEHSCVILAEIGDYRVLLTGDSGVQQERQFSHWIGKIDFLQVGHHGSKTSTSYTLLAQTLPNWAIISASRFNPWKMPSLSVTSRLDEFGIKWLNTAKQGMVRVRFYPESYEIQTERDGWQPWYSGYFGQ